MFDCVNDFMKLNNHSELHYVGFEVCLEITWDSFSQILYNIPQIAFNLKEKTVNSSKQLNTLNWFGISINVIDGCADVFALKLNRT